MLLNVQTIPQGNPFALTRLLFYLGKMILTENSYAISLLKIAHISPLMSKLQMILFYLLAQSQ